MNKLEEFEQQLFDDGYILDHCRLDAPYKAFCVEHSKIIAINETNVKNDQERFCALVHEIEHFNLSSFYRLDHYCPLYVHVQEGRVNIATAKRLIPMDLLFDFIFKLKLDINEIALKLFVTEDMVMYAYNYYSQLESWLIKIKRLEGISHEY